MKKNLASYILITSMLFVTVSCTKDVKDWSKALVTVAPHYLSLSQTSLSFADAEGGTQTFDIKAPDTSWEIADLPEWLSVDKKSGTGNTTITVSCSANASPTDARVTLFSVRSVEDDWEYSMGISTSQVRCKQYVNPSKTQVSFEGKEGSQSVDVTSNVDDWSVSASASWLTAGKRADGKAIDIHVTGNPNNTSRTAYVILKTGDEEKQITVVQRAGNISATLDKLTYEHEAASQKVTITSDAPWTAQTASSWIEVVPSSGNAGTTEVSVRTLANNSFDARTGYVYFVMADDNKVELPVEQGAITFSLSVSSLAFSHSASTRTVTINTNAEWELVSDLPDWLTVSKREGKGNTDVEVSAEEYLSENISPRNATLCFKPKKIGRNFDVAVSQTGQELDLNTTALQFTNKSGSQSLSFTATGDWTITPATTWITITPTSGTGDATCTVTVEENTSDERVGDLVLTFYEDTYRIPVTQQGSYLTLSTEGLQFGSTGGTLRVEIASNNRWDAAVKDNVSWLDVNPKSGEDNDVLTISASDNPSADGRNGEVFVTPQDRTPLHISVAQAARYLNISTNSIDFLASGGTSELITVDTDGTFEVTTESDWLTINMVGEKSFTVTADENNLYTLRKGNLIISLTNLISGKIEKTIAIQQKGLNMHNGHELVDLGLPSGLLWATMNVGANSPEEYGDYFAWGEITTKNVYDWSTYKCCNGSYTTMTKYNTDSSYGTVDNKTVLDLEDDAARVNWGGSWRMPTNAEFYELFNSCTWTWTTQGGHNGYKVESKSNGNSIFLPAAGYRYGTSLSGAGSIGYYWSSSLNTSNPYDAWLLYFDSISHSTNGGNRESGRSVRSVCP